MPNKCALRFSKLKSELWFSALKTLHELVPEENREKKFWDKFIELRSQYLKKVEEISEEEYRGG